MAFAISFSGCLENSFYLNSDEEQVGLEPLDLASISDLLANDSDLQFIFAKTIEVQMLMTGNNQISDMRTFTESFGEDKKAFFKGLSKQYESLDYNYLSSLNLELEDAQTRLMSRYDKEFSFIRASDNNLKEAFYVEIRRRFDTYYLDNVDLLKNGNCADALCANETCDRLLWCLVRTQLCGFLDSCIDNANAWTTTIIGAGFIGMNPIGISAGVVGGIIYRGWAVDNCQQDNYSKCDMCQSECEK